MNLFHRSGRDQTKPDETENTENKELSEHDKFVERLRVDVSDEIPDAEKNESETPESADTDDDEEIGERERDFSVEGRSKDSDDDENIR